MQSWILFCDVFHDGIGDYIHFEDITKAIMANNALNNIQLTAVIRVDPDSKDCNKELIQKKLSDLKINFYYNQELNEPSLLQTLATADKAIIISRVSDFDKDYNKFLKKKPPIIYIGEHETATNRYNIGRSFSCRTLGLSDNFYGIKIPSIIKMNAEESWDTIHQSDINFASILDECTQCYSFNEFSQKVTLIPSYFNKPYDFLSFLSFLSTKLILSNEKKVVIYCSGVNMLDFFQDRIDRQGDKFDAKKVNERFNQSDIRELEIVYARGESIIIPANSQGQQSITLLTGFYLTDSSYDAIYFLSKESEIAPVIKKTKAPTKQKSIESTSETIKEIIEYLNQCAGTVFKPSSKIAVTNINLRLKEGYSLDDFKKVIYIKSNKWLNTDYAQHLNPKTLFGDKFENYVNENLTTPKTKQQKNIENVTKATELGWNT